MKLAYLLQQVYHEPALIMPEAHASIRHLLESRINQSLVTSAATSSEEAAQRQAMICGEKVDLPSMTIDEDGIAHIPVGGAIGQKLGNFAKWAGAVDVADVAIDLAEAEASKKVRGIIMDIDSPGGMVAGTPELAARIAEVTKPCYAFSNGLIASAAYWLASACDGIFTTVSAQSGSIGVYMAVYDESQAYEQAGIKVELIKAGTLKGLGYPGTSMTEAGRAYLQERVNEIYSMFKAQVKANRPEVSEETMQGQVFLGAQAEKRGLIDAVVKDKAEVIRAVF
jgi:signal peptide peptidase SppA